LIVTIILIGLMIIAGVLYQQIGVARDRSRYPPPGKMMDVGGSRLHVEAMGTGDLAVVFEAGVAATSLSWRLVQSEVAKVAQAVSYDRAGLGWSESVGGKRDVTRLVEELRSALLNVTLPRIIVAHSYGGLIALQYASQYPSEVAGLVLVDSVGMLEWANPSPVHRATLRRAIFLARLGGILASVGVVRFALDLVEAGSQRIPKLLARTASGRSGAAFTERIGGEIRKLPRELWPMIQAHWSDAKSFDAMARYLKALPENAAIVLANCHRLDIPIVILSAGNASAGQRADHHRVAALSSRGRVQVVENCGHWIQFDHPHLVIDAIRDVMREL
jgi:pimeloyl-ACP methyl ester carboxylesterase